MKNQKESIVKIIIDIELFNMEDIIPSLILIILLCSVENIKEELDLMVDFIGFDPCDLEGERRLLVNMSVKIYLFRNLLII